jgi:DNA-binding response OmpR family regulator
VTRILVVEDEPGIAFALKVDLETEGYDVTLATDGLQGLKLATEGSFDLLLLDVMLPGKDGFEVCRQLRRAGSDVATILLTARAQEAEKVMGLELGADDYITKPFSPRELRARVKAVLRRRAGSEPEIFSFSDVEVDFVRYDVRKGGEPVELSALEFKLLATFIRSRGRVLTREQLLDATWGRGVAVNERVVDNHIVSLRRKLEADPVHPKHFKNIRGIGYRFDA